MARERHNRPHADATIRQRSAEQSAARMGRSATDASLSENPPDCAAKRIRSKAFALLRIEQRLGQVASVNRRQVSDKFLSQLL